IYHTSYVLATTPDLASFTEHLGGSHDYHHPHFINEKQKSLTQVCAMPKVTQWMTGITDSTFLGKPGSNISYVSKSADSRGHENTGKGTRKADETGMSSEKEERRIEPDFEGREYRKQD
ncbi:hypothetical protein, partial [Klebsiella pneumoniae]